MCVCMFVCVKCKVGSGVWCSGGRRATDLGAEVGLKDFLQTLGRIDVHGKRNESLGVLSILIQEFKRAHCFCVRSRHNMMPSR